MNKHRKFISTVEPPMNKHRKFISTVESPLPQEYFIRDDIRKLHETC